MVARAMANCGLHELRLVKPRDGWPHANAIPAASGAQQILHDAVVYDDLASAVADRNLVFGTCAFERELVKPVLTAEAAATAIVTAAHAKTAYVFGPERTGLSKDDLALCDGMITIPLDPNFASLNIAQSVLLVSYCWWQQAVLQQPHHVPDVLNVLALNESDSASQDEIDNLYQHAIWTLEQKNYFTNPQNESAQRRNARAFLQRMRLTVQEARSAHGMLKAMLDGKMWTKD